ncbi:terminase gpP N-terminus-related DNA-binding protein [Xanthobacter sp. TB0139]|uniref:terminase gpP N-terminus-related DNA-binding protein n=1 Tax=Xanthobacter sp. TB0139 TaxID=3459178 RepID=UPI004039A112
MSKIAAPHAGARPAAACPELSDKAEMERRKQARQLYESGVPLVEIARQTGLSRHAIYYWADRDVSPEGVVSLRPARRRMPRRALPARRKQAGSSRRSPAPQAALGEAGLVLAPRSVPRPPQPRRQPRQRLLARLWRTAERQVAEIEGRMQVAHGDAELSPRTAADSEKDARALALIARTLRELAAAEDEAGRSRSAKPDTQQDGEPDGTRNLEDFRSELARRLEQLQAADDPPVAVEPE